MATGLRGRARAGPSRAGRCPLRVHGSPFTAIVTVRSSQRVGVRRRSRAYCGPKRLSDRRVWLARLTAEGTLPWQALVCGRTEESHCRLHMAEAWEKSQCV